MCHWPAHGHMPIPEPAAAQGSGVVAMGLLTMQGWNGHGESVTSAK